MYICAMKKCMEKKAVVCMFLIHVAVALSRCLFVIFGHLDLHYEEAQYWTWSQHLDWSYYSKPPLIAYVNYISQAVFGHSEFAVRFNAIALGFLSAVVLYLLAKEMTRDTTKAIWASLLIYVMPFFQGASMFFSTDALLLFFYLWALYLAWLAVKYDHWKHWLWFGVALGLGYLSKYAMLFFLPAFGIYLWMMDRRVLTNTKLYVSIALSFCFFIPVMIWGAQHDFVDYKHLAHLSGTHDIPLTWGKRIGKILEYVGGQLAIISPLFLVMYTKAFRRIKCNKSMWFLASHGLMIFILFLYVAATRRSGANINWTMFAYVGFPIILSSYLVDVKKQKVASVLSIITIILLMIGTNLSCLDVIGMKRVMPSTSDPSKHMVGWNELSDDLLDLEKSLNTDKVFFFSDSYHVTSELLFYMYPRHNVYFVNVGKRMNQFDLWNKELGGINQYANQGYTGIFISSKCFHSKDHLLKDAPLLPDEVQKSFAPGYEYHTHITYLRGAPVYQFYIYVLKDFTSFKGETEGY